jgi:5-methylcytosine-specific restriction enzyme subunit McrC
MNPIVVREYAYLTTSPLAQNTLDHAQVSESAFDWLCGLEERRTNGGRLLSVVGRNELQLRSFVGVLESPCGQVIEILPKHLDLNDPEPARALMCRLVAGGLNLPLHEADEAGLRLFRTSLSEWIMGRFLTALEHLLKRGLRFDYLRVEEESRYLRGQLDVARQLRQPPHKGHLLHIRHDVFLANRPENRLLKAALDAVAKRTRDAQNWRLSHELGGVLRELPASHDAEQDFRVWRDDRLMVHYRPVKPWCELILRQHLPHAVHGDWRGISFLFPMERLFEDYVARWMHRHLQNGARLVTQARRHSLCRHRGREMFQLRPDLLLEQGERRWAMDTKWKRLDATATEQKYGIAQGDFYQMFAYGHHYQGGQGDMALIYPKGRDFAEPLPPFEMQPGLRLWVLPFDLETEMLLLPQSWSEEPLPLKISSARAL